MGSTVAASSARSSPRSWPCTPCRCSTDPSQRRRASGSTAAWRTRCSPWPAWRTTINCRASHSAMTCRRCAWHKRSVTTPASREYISTRPGWPRLRATAGKSSRTHAVPCSPVRGRRRWCGPTPPSPRHGRGPSTRIRSRRSPRSRAPGTASNGPRGPRRWTGCRGSTGSNWRRRRRGRSPAQVWSTRACWR